MNFYSCVPWSDEQSWAEMCLSFLTAAKNIETRNQVLRQLAEQVALDNGAIDDCFNTVCNMSCVVCRDVCCARATVWYDFKDLLFSYYHIRELPPHQVYRLPSGDCVYLGVDGCRLERNRRPFLCNWYVCPDQKKMIEDCGNNKWKALQLRIEKIQAARKEMEEKFIKLLS